MAKLNCSLLGLNWRLTPNEVHYVLANSGAHVLVCDDADPAALVAATRDLPIKLLISIDTATSRSILLPELLQADNSARFAQKDPPLTTAYRQIQNHRLEFRADNVKAHRGIAA